MRLSKCACVALAFCCSIPTSSHVAASVIATLPVAGISHNNSTDETAGEAQLTIDVGNDIGGALTLVTGQVRFTFHNTGPAASSITDIYFDDGTLLGIAFLENAAGVVEFSVGASPGELPAAANAVPPFETTAGFSADSDPPVQPLGVNPGEKLGIVFNLQPGKTMYDVVDDVLTGELRIGLHVQGFAGGGSESFVNLPVPEPMTIWMVGLALASVRLRRR